jgi:menaquinone-specific isochorismate synthase
MNTTDPTNLREQLITALRERLSKPLPTAAVISFAIPMSPVDLVDWLSAQTLFPRLYWQARANPTCYGAIGSAITLDHDTTEKDQWSHIEALTRDAPELAFFCGMRFDASQEPDTEWDAFGNALFMLPRFVVEQDADGTRLRCNISVDGDSRPDALRQRLEAEIEMLVTNVSHVEGRPSLDATVSEIPDEPTWKASVQKITHAIEQCELQKVVLARRMDVTFSDGANPFLFMRHFHAMKSPAYYFCFQLSPEHAFVGSSPECLYRRVGRKITSEALAGTRRRGGTPDTDQALRASLETSPKDRHEHQLVAEHIHGALAPLCDTIEPPTEPTVVQLVLVQHLHSSVGGDLHATTSDRDILSALHPTPAVGGVPAAAALRTIQSLEPFDRGWYAAPLGMITRDTVDLTVAIRSGLLHGSTLSLYCGAGIVSASDPSAEWEETESKFENFLHVIHVE